MQLFTNLFLNILVIVLIFRMTDLIILGDLIFRHICINYVSNEYFFDIEWHIYFLVLTNIMHVLNADGRTLDLFFSISVSSVVWSDCCLISENLHHPSLNIINTRKFMFHRNAGYNFKKANFFSLYNYLLSVDWTALVSLEDVNELCSCLYDIIDTIFSKSIPKATRNNEYYPNFF